MLEALKSQNEQLLEAINKLKSEGEQTKNQIASDKVITENEIRRLNHPIQEVEMSASKKD